jgi:hypothetical protein
MAKPQYPIDGKLGKHYRVTSSFGWRIHPIRKVRRHHNGVDLWGGAEPLYIEAWHDGVVTFAGTSRSKKADGSVGGLGWFVEIRSKVNGKYYVSRYGHMVPKSLKVKTGQKVEAGTVLGKMGTSGDSTGKHLHFEIYAGKVYRFTTDGSGFVDPLRLIENTIAHYKLIADAPKATPEDAPVAPAPVHEKVSSTPKAALTDPIKKSVKTIAGEVIAGKWEVGAARAKKLTEAGHNAKAVQAMVNQILSGKK